LLSLLNNPDAVMKYEPALNAGWNYSHTCMPSFVMDS